MGECTAKGIARPRVDVDTDIARYMVSPRSDGQIEVRIDGEVDLAATAAHESVLDAVDQLLQEKTAPIVVEMGGITFCDSSGLALLVRLKYLADRGEVPLVLQDVPEVVKRLLDATGLRDELDVPRGA